MDGGLLVDEQEDAAAVSSVGRDWMAVVMLNFLGVIYFLYKMTDPVGRDNPDQPAPVIS